MILFQLIYQLEYNMNSTNNYENLIKRIEELEKQIQGKVGKDESHLDTRRDLSSYNDRIKTNKEIIIKENAYIKNRKGIFSWAENVLALGFNKTDTNRLNQIQIGIDRDENTQETIKETNTVFISATENPTAVLDDTTIKDESVDLVKASNGAIIIQSQRGNEEYGGIQIGEREKLITDKEGTAAMLFGSKTNGLAGIGNVIEYNGQELIGICFHTEQDSISTGGVYQQKLMQFVDILPSSDGGIVPALGRKSYHYKELVLRSPDGSSFAVRVDNAGALTATKLWCQ